MRTFLTLVALGCLLVSVSPASVSPVFTLRERISKLKSSPASFASFHALRAQPRLVEPGHQQQGATSGVTVDDECYSKYQELKLGKLHRAVIFKRTDDWKQIVVEKTLARGTTYAEFMKELPDDQCRYAVFDFEYTLPDDVPASKLIFFDWKPDNAKMRQKTEYTTSKDSIRKKLVGIGSEVKGTDKNEISYDSVLGMVKRS